MTALFGYGSSSGIRPEAAGTPAKYPEARRGRRSAGNSHAHHWGQSRHRASETSLPIPPASSSPRESGTIVVENIGSRSRTSRAVGCCLGGRGGCSALTTRVADVVLVSRPSRRGRGRRSGTEPRFQRWGTTWRTSSSCVFRSAVRRITNFLGERHRRMRARCGDDGPANGTPCEPTGRPAVGPAYDGCVHSRRIRSPSLVDTPPLTPPRVESL